MNADPLKYRCGLVNGIGNQHGGLSDMSPDIPASLDEVLTPKWLTSALSQRFPSVVVTAVIRGPVVSRLSTNARFTIECSGPLPKDLKPDLCVKGYFSEFGRASGAAGEPEAYFYRDAIEHTGVQSLNCVYADGNENTKRNVIITEDVVASGGEFLDTLSAYTPDQAAESLTQLANLHASTWLNPRFAETQWLDWRIPSYRDYRKVEDIQIAFDGPLGAGIPHEAKDAFRLRAAVKRLTAGDPRTSGTWSIIHADPHVGNVFLDKDGHPRFLDWQTVQRGPWSLDVSYHIASSLTEGDRHRNERDLVSQYLDELKRLGVEAPTWNEAWLEYRKGMAHGFFMWAITKLVDFEMIETLLRRLGTAAAELDTLGLLGV
jgi:thiamine kinase-like enzyme